jgi:tetratricopeptide (TPR) repeat protein
VQGRTADALPLLRRALELDGRRPGELKPLASSAGSPAGDDLSFVEAIRLMDDRWEDLEYLGQALVEQGKAAQALLALERASALAPTSAGPRVWLVQAYEAVGQRDRAREELAALRRLDPAAAGRLSVR